MYVPCCCLSCKRVVALRVLRIKEYGERFCHNYIIKRDNLETINFFAFGLYVVLPQANQSKIIRVEYAEARVACA